MKKIVVIAKCIEHVFMDIIIIEINIIILLKNIKINKLCKITVRQNVTVFQFVHKFPINMGNLAKPHLEEYVLDNKKIFIYKK